MFRPKALRGSPADYIVATLREKHETEHGKRGITEDKLEAPRRFCKNPATTRHSQLRKTELLFRRGRVRGLLGSLLLLRLLCRLGSIVRLGVVRERNRDGSQSKGQAQHQGHQFLHCRYLLVRRRYRRA